MISARDLAFVGCRLLALYVLWFILTYVAQSIPFVFQGLPWSAYASANLIALVANLAVFVALWFGAGRIAGMVATGTAEPHADQAQNWSRQSALSLVVIALGLWVLIHHLPDLIGYVPLIFPDPADEIWPDVAVHPPTIISAVLTSVFGLLCILGPRGIANFIGRLRRW